MPPTAPLPERFNLHRDGALEIRWRWAKSAIPLLLIFCCGPGFCGLYGRGLVAGTVPPAHVQLPWLGYLMMAGSLLIAACIAYLVLASLLNHSVLRAERGLLRLRQRPLPFKDVELRTSDIARFQQELSSQSRRMREQHREHTRASLSRSQPSSGGKAADEYELYVLDHQGKRYRLLDGLDTLDQCAWVELELKRALGMLEPEAQRES